MMRGIKAILGGWPASLPFICEGTSWFNMVTAKLIELPEQCSNGVLLFVSISGPQADSMNLVAHC